MFLKFFIKNFKKYLGYVEHIIFYNDVIILVNFRITSNYYVLLLEKKFFLYRIFYLKNIVVIIGK